MTYWREHYPKGQPEKLDEFLIGWKKHLRSRYDDYKHPSRKDVHNICFPDEKKAPKEVSKPQAVKPAPQPIYQPPKPTPTPAAPPPIVIEKPMAQKVQDIPKLEDPRESLTYQPVQVVQKKSKWKLALLVAGSLYAGNAFYNSTQSLFSSMDYMSDLALARTMNEFGGTKGKNKKNITRLFTSATEHKEKATIYRKRVWNPWQTIKDLYKANFLI